VGRSSGTAKPWKKNIQTPIFVVALAVRQHDASDAIHKSSASAPEKKGIKPMELSEQERERIRQEELVRLQLRKEMKRSQRPQLIVLTALWVAVLTILVFVSLHYHH
jgi:membrane-associated HD superfamily phosphohydrolase